MHRAPKDGHTRAENRWTQPMRPRRTFCRTDVLTEGWYPALDARALRRGTARSVRLGGQRIALFRGEDGAVHALDAFCPHMGADLGNGEVRGDTVTCRLHGWRFGGDGACRATATGTAPPSRARVRTWPVHEAFGVIWLFSAEQATHPFPTCPGLEGAAVAAFDLGTVRLYAHHHAMMAGGIDLQHFKAVHGVDIAFAHETVESDGGVLDYRLEGHIPAEGWRGRAARWLLGDRGRYAFRVAGGSVAAITYGVDQRLFGAGRPLPSLHVLWGCVPLEEGVSEVRVFLLAPRPPGLGGALRWGARIAATMALLAVLDDDDRRAFPHMRFDPAAVTREDEAVLTLVRHLERLPVSPWSPASPHEPTTHDRTPQGPASAEDPA